MAALSVMWKWQMSKMAKHPDSIASSEFGDTIPFKASFETDKSRPNMFDIMSMEYARIWKKESEVAGSVPLVEKNEGAVILLRTQIKRRKVQATEDDSYSKPPFYIKKFLKVQARVNSFRSKDDKAMKMIIDNKKIQDKNAKKKQ